LAGAQEVNHPVTAIPFRKTAVRACCKLTSAHPKITEGMRLGDPTQSESDMEQDPSLKAVLRLASIAFPSIVTILSLLLCWRAHFSKNSLGASVLAIAIGIYFTIYYGRRSRGLSANLGNNNPGPDRDWSYNDQSDIGALWAAAPIIGVLAYTVFKHW
jgi:hypothetical protein